MSKKNKLNRREFVRNSLCGVATAFSVPYIIPSGILASPERPGANDRICVGVIGPGRQGSSLMGQAVRMKDMELVAFADVYQARLDSALGKHPKAKGYRNYRELLADPNIDAVFIATPDHWHGINTVHACEAGKDVYVEKPMSLTVREGQLMLKAARDHERVVMTGSMQRSMKESRIGCEMVRNNRAGKIHTVHTKNYPSSWECTLPAQPVPEGLDWDMWCGQTEPRPYHEALYFPRGKGTKDERGPQGWISYRPYSGGEVTGWGPHGLDMIQWALGMDLTGPVEVWPEGEGLWAPVSYRYANGIVVHLDDGGPAGGGHFIGDKGEIVVDRNRYDARPKTIVLDPIGKEEINLEISNNHIRNWLDCIRSRKTPITDVAVGHSSTNVCHIINIARRVGRKLQWDPEKEQFINDEEANSHLERSMRSPYVF
ncbi:MAG: Gfo/Idh/MocA family oxidoreductase [Candidatus Hydrogenedentes bacterium]|nr:Gfo/Idh/MocA family oxidoreductase [Candidatus Hydrogenedentota bacterium]